MNIEKNIENACAYIDRMSLSGLNQDLAYLAKQELRSAYKALTEKPIKEGENENG
jgi:hypothetical protein